MPALLVVDDDPTIRSMFARALKALGEVDLAAHGGEALRMLGSKRYDVVLLDLHMPVMDGFVVLHTLANRLGPNKATPVFVVTADASEQARIRALRRHAVFLLTKPVPIGTLTALVESTLKKAAARGAGPQARERAPDKDRAPDSEQDDEARGSSPPRSSDPGSSSASPQAPAKRPGSNPSWGEAPKKK